MNDFLSYPSINDLWSVTTKKYLPLLKDESQSLTETDNELKIELLLPGVSNPSLEYFEPELRVVCEEVKEENSKLLHSYYKSFHTRSWTLNKDLYDIDNVTASHKNGVLTILVPKKVKPKKEVKNIPITR